jgi:hypothetical protein
MAAANETGELALEAHPIDEAPGWRNKSRGFMFRITSPYCTMRST